MPPRQDAKKTRKPPVKKTTQLNLAIHRAVLDATGDFLGALIVEFIHYRFKINDSRPVWLKIDWIYEKLPYISRSGLAKKLNKLVSDGHIIMRRGEGRHYHRCWYSPSADMRTACSTRGNDSVKVYYNVAMAEDNLQASVIYATIVNLLKINEEEDTQTKVKHSNIKAGAFYGRTDNQLLLDYQKLVEGSGLSLSTVRKAVRWLINTKNIIAKKAFGNKLMVSLPADISLNSEDLPTESYPHFDPGEEEASELYEHRDDLAREMENAAQFLKPSKRKP